jgi:hypothetical protein
MTNTIDEYLVYVRQTEEACPSAKIVLTEIFASIGVLSLHHIDFFLALIALKSSILYPNIF